MIEYKNGGIILVGGDKLFQLAHAEAQWVEMGQKLTVWRTAHSAFLVPDDIVYCS
jgi:hypothetical protein